MLQDPRATAVALFEQRRRRQSAFGDFADLFADPAWDILLLLFAQQHEGETLVKAACSASQAPKATALRVVQTLEDRGLVQRRSNPRDYRSKLIELTDEGRMLVGRALASSVDEASVSSCGLTVITVEKPSQC